MATTVTPTTFKVRFPEFISENNDRVQVFIDDAVVQINEVFWSTKFDIGISYLAAHFLELANTSVVGGGASVGGMVSGQSVDGTSINFAVPTIKDTKESFYMSTTYGQRYWALLKSLGSGAISV